MSAWPVGGVVGVVTVVTGPGTVVTGVVTVTVGGGAGAVGDAHVGVVGVRARSSGRHS